MLAAEILDLITTDEYARGAVIIAFAEALGTSGIDELERMAREQLYHGPGGEHYDLAITLENIADARGDVDGYIAAQRLAGSEPAAVKEIAERPVAAGRLQEAFGWAERADVPALERGYIARLKVGILDRLDRTEDAQASPLVDIRDLVVPRHSGRISRPVAGGHHGRGSPNGDRGRPRASRRPPGLVFVGRPRFGYCCRAGARRLGEIQGEVYFVLRPVADRLAETHLVAAILLYREMADAVLRNGQSLQYNHAVRDLVAAERLVPRVKDWLGHLSQEVYRQRVATEHRQKRGVLEEDGAGGIALARMILHCSFIRSQ